MKQSILLIFFLFFLVYSCERVDVKKGELKDTFLEKIDGIPMEYGTLISVTTHAEYEGWAQLWFVDDDNTIRLVRVQFHKNLFDSEVLVIPRN